MPGKKGGNPAWTKGGPSPNPGGRPKSPVKLRALYDEHKDDERVYKRLWEWIDSDNAKASLAALAILLDRRYGRPATVDADGDTVTDSSVVVEVRQYGDGN